MGQLYSRILGCSPVPPLLNLPIEILVSVTDQLSSSPESIVALSLTCKALFHIFESEVANLKGHPCRSSLLVLLEKDLSDRFFYCSMCCRLHRFLPWWNPVNTRHAELNNTRHAQQLFDLGTSQYRLSYAHARLVMNRHLYGPPKGLPLGSLALENSGGMVWAHSCILGLLWRQRPAARIIGDELFLRITFTIEGTAAAMREAIDRGRRYRVCMHVMTRTPRRIDCRNGVRAIPELARPGGEEEEEEKGDRSSFKACRDVLGSCAVCLTDYITTVERAQVREVFYSPHTRNRLRIGPVVDGWRVSITVYHGMGPCRELEDWRWVALVGGETASGSVSPAPSGRDMAIFPPGWARQKWLDENQQSEELYREW